MFLSKFKIHNFRSVQNTDWIETNQLSCLVGKNEAGKTNFLLPLFKFNPAVKDNFSRLNPQRDYPRSYYNDFESSRELQEQPFISILFKLNHGVANKINKLITDFSSTIVEEKENKIEDIEFSNNDVILVEKNWKNNFYFYKSDEDGNKLSVDIAGNDYIEEQDLIDILPKFIYYSEYGNLDSSMHLPTIKGKIDNPNIIENDKDMQKIRTAKILFDFVGLSLDNLIALGREDNYHTLNNEQKEQEEKNKQLRVIKTTSASTSITNKFNEWWKDNNYIFHFETEGSYFWINVSDAIRKDKIEFEYRSRGLQWFFSFYLVFLVESEKSHQNCILLLDEPGLSLHPNAQKDLIEFFNSLSEKNQLIYTTHLPFLVDHNNIDRVVGIFVDKRGISKGTNNLSEIDGGDKTKSIQPVNAAIGISAAESLLFNCQVVIVEGISDQFYLSIIKSALISEGKIKPEKEIAFIPVKGTPSIPTTVSIIQGKNYELPYVIVDSDEAGRKRANDLKNGFYQKEKNKIIEIKEVIGFDNSEIEDLIPPKILINLFDKLVRNDDEDFENVHEEGKPIIDQMNKFLTGHDLENEEKLKGWKVEISKKFKTNFKINDIPQEYIEKWEKLFNKIITINN